MTRPVDLIVSGDAVLTVDPRGSVVRAGAVAVRDGAIVAVGPREAVVAEFAARETLHTPGGVILPGWVNTHTHLAMNVFRGAADDVTLEEFLERLVAAELHVLGEGMVEVGVRAAIAECLAGGTTTALDMYWYPQAARKVARQTGFRLLNGPTFLGERDPDGRDFEGMLERAREILEENRAQRPLERLWVMPHSVYTLDGRQLAMIAQLARRFGARVHTHASESVGEVLESERLHGERPIAVLASAGLLGPETVLAHAVQLDDREIASIAAAGAGVAHCPASNLKLGCGIARVPELLGAKVPVGLGTDGAASAGTLDMFAAVRLAALIHKGVTGDPTMIGAQRAVRLGTVEGARSLGLRDVGTLEEGMRADLQVVRIDTLHSAPVTDPWSAIAYGASASDVVHTVVDGRVVLRDRLLQTIDEASALRDLAASAALAATAIDGTSE
jgi:5-methylthioadenosine/S-adenosylhomocysteine deaminase